MENPTLFVKGEHRTGQDGFTFQGSSSSPKLVWALRSVEEWTRKGIFLKQDRLDMKQGGMGQDKTRREHDKNESSMQLIREMQYING